MTKMTQKEKALTGIQEQLKPNQMAFHTTARRFDGPVEIRSCTRDLLDTLPTYSDASTLSSSDLLSLSLAVSLASLATSSETAALIDLLTIFQDYDLMYTSLTFESRA